jgi:hypothetical protein
MHLARSASARRAKTGGDGLRHLSKVFAHYRGSPPQQLVLKTGMGGIAGFGGARAVWPAVPCLMIIRNPAEVIVSNLNRVASSVRDWRVMPESCVLGTPPTEVISACAQEFCGWVVGRVYAEALAQLDDKCMVLDYKDITPESVMEIAAFFGLRVSEGRERAFQDTFLFHAKRGHLFDSDTEAKLQAATSAVVGSADRWSSRLYRDLLKSRLRIGVRN